MKISSLEMEAKCLRVVLGNNALEMKISSLEMEAECLRVVLDTLPPLHLRTIEVSLSSANLPPAHPENIC